MRRYSGFALMAEGLRGQRGWQPLWRTPDPKPGYDVLVVGGGGHGLATAYYLKKNHGVGRVALLERQWIGSGNSGRNTSVIRSNYFYPQSVALYDFALKLYETLARELNYNIMFSQRGMVILAHCEQEMEIAARIVNAMQINGTDAALFGPEEVRKVAPLVNFAADARFPVHGGIWQGRAGTARHDAVVWAYARAADALGVDIIQNCEVESFLIEGGRCRGVETSRGTIRAERIGLAVAGHSAVLASKAGFSLPLEIYALQAMVSEPVKPVLDTVVFSPGSGTYVSQSDKGELVFGGGLDRFRSYAQRGSAAQQAEVIAGLLEIFPSFAQLKLLRQWAGTVDVTPDSSPIIGPGPLPGLYLNCGWGTGGFKAIPAGGWLFAHLLAEGEHHPISRPFDLDRFARGALIDEAAGAGIAH